MRDALQDERRLDAALGVDHEIETPPGERAAEELAEADPDAGILDDLVEIGSDEGLERFGIDGLAPTCEPGDARGRPGAAEGCEERELHEPVPHQLPAGIDEDGRRIGLHGPGYLDCAVLGRCRRHRAVEVRHLPAYLTAENEVGCRIMFSSEATMGPSRSVSARLATHSGS